MSAESDRLSPVEFSHLLFGDIWPRRQHPGDRCGSDARTPQAAATPRKGSTKPSLYQKQATAATWPGSARCSHDEQEGAFVASATTAGERDEERA